MHKLFDIQPEINKNDVCNKSNNNCIYRILILNFHKQNKRFEVHSFVDSSYAVTLPCKSVGYLL